MLSERNSFLLIFVLRKSILNLLTNDFATQQASQNAKLLFKATKKLTQRAECFLIFPAKITRVSFIQQYVVSLAVVNYYLNKKRLQKKRRCKDVYFTRALWNFLSFFRQIWYSVREYPASCENAFWSNCSHEKLLYRDIWPKAPDF